MDNTPDDCAGLAENCEPSQDPFEGARVGAPPAPAEIPDPFRDPLLTRYLASVRRWHGYIRFLGLPYLGDAPDTEIDRLYVEPLLSPVWISPDVEPERWGKTAELLEEVAEHPRLVVLGDPGTGKSTLVNWLSWQFARRTANAWTSRLGSLVPLPFVLRELRIPTTGRWDDLMQSLLEHDMVRGMEQRPQGVDSMNGPAVSGQDPDSRTALRERFQSLMERGAALILLDGLDEISHRDARQALRSAVLEGMARFPENRWLLTSRIVGYEEVPFDQPEALHPEARIDGLFRTNGPELPSPGEITRADPLGSAAIRRRYVAPFKDEQIQQFARNWYTQREAVPERAHQESENLARAVFADKGTLRLARIPNLLTMMSLIFRNRARLPNGRALLYNEITQAYLQSIDEYRGLDGAHDHPLAQKKRWLARVGYEMQQRRTERGEAGHKKPAVHGPRPEPAEREMLFTPKEVKEWLSSAMAGAGQAPDQLVVEQFLDHILRRSGLLIPRGEDALAFIHLSMQEYFAALFLEEQMLSPRAQKSLKSRLPRLARDPRWRETLVFLFELMADRPDWPEELAVRLFGSDFGRLHDPADEGAQMAQLLARLVVNPHSGLSDAMRRRGAEACCMRQLEEEKLRPTHSLEKPMVFSVLFTAETEYMPVIWDALRSAVERTGSERLNLTGIEVSDISPLSAFSRLKSLELLWTKVQNIAALSMLNGLTELDLSLTRIEDAAPLANLIQLRTLWLSYTRVQDLSPLRALLNLELLDLAGTQVADLSPLSSLENLVSVFLSGVKMRDTTPLMRLTRLTCLYLDASKIDDLSGLTRLPHLKYLFVERIKPQGIQQIGGLNHLTTLDVSSYDFLALDLSPLSQLEQLKKLAVRGNGALTIELKPLAGIASLRSLTLSGCHIFDLTPLGALSQLEELDLSRSTIPDVPPLCNLPSLKKVNLSQVSIHDLGPLMGRKGLQIIR